MKRAWGAAAAVAVGAGIVLWLWPDSPESRIRREWRELVESLAKTGPENPVAAAGRARDAARRFMEHPEIAFDLMPAAVESRDDVAAAVFQARSCVETLSVQTYGDEVQLDPGRTSAVLRVSARASAVRNGEREQAVREFEIRWFRTPEGWRIAVAREVRAIRPVP